MDLRGLSLICAGLGRAEEDEDRNLVGYTKGQHCLDNMKDLLRFLRRDDPQTREVFKQVCKWKTVSKDLIPIIQYCRDERELVLNAVKVLVFLTMPIEPWSSDIPQQTEYLWGLKSAITCSDTIAVIVSLLEDPLENLERESFSEDDWKLLQLVLTLFRNVLAIQDISMLQKVGGSSCQFLSLRDRFLELLFHENVMDLIIAVTQHVAGSYGYLRHDNILLLEIFHYIFMGQDPDLIAKSCLKEAKGGGDTKAFLDSFKSLMDEEEEKKKLSRLQNMSRHAQFNGTFTKLTMDGSKAVCKGNPSSGSHNILLKGHKSQRGRVKKTVWDHGKLPSVKDNILEQLHNFLNQFLSGAYNVLMQSIHEDIEKEHHAVQKNDIMVFFQVAQFVTSFQYHKFLTSKLPNLEKDTFEAFDCGLADSTLFKGDICGPIAASMSESMFLLVISRWRDAFDGLKETNNYKFLSASGSLMKIMIRMLDLVLKLLPEDTKEPQTARILLYKLFYDQTDQGMTQFLLGLIKSFDIHKQPKSDLADLMEIIHVIVRLMESLQGRGTLRVSKKSRRSRKKKEPSDGKETGNELCQNEVNIGDQNAPLNTNHSTDVDLLQKKSQENSTYDNEENINAAAQVDEPYLSALELGSNLPKMNNRTTDHIDDLSCSSDDSSADEQRTATCEVDFKVSTFVSTFANHSIIKNLCWLLKFYKSNSLSTNHYIICMLQKITDDLDLSPMLYQLSLLTIFHEILAEQKLHPCEEFANIVDFLTTLVRRMLRKMKNQPLLFVEVLFWKSRRECHYINAEYLLHELGHMKKESTRWGNGAVGSSQAEGWVPRSIADALGEDEADVVIYHELGNENMREKLDEVEKDTSSNSVDGKENSKDGENNVQHEAEQISKRKRRLVLTPDLETRIKDLYEKFKDDANCSCLIAESLNPDGQVSPAQVFNKLKQLGLKVATNKRMRHVDRSLSAHPDQPVEEGSIMEKESNLHNPVVSEGSLQTKSLSSRKRVHAFNKDQEEMIKTLFEQFKDHKRCNHMIANALAADNSFTAAQVSRKLKQLGLRIPQQKRSRKSKADMHQRDEDFNDSDDETLLSLRSRSKIKDDSRLSSGELPKQNVEGELSTDSEGELLSSVLKSKTKDGDGLCSGELPKQNISGDSDDEFVSSVIKKKGKLLPEVSDKKLTIDRRVNNGSFSKEIPENVAEGNESRQPDWTNMEGTDDEIAFSNIDKKVNPETSNVNGKLEANTEDDESSHEQLDDELADFDDDAAHGAILEDTVPRRKMRIVIDDDDED